jgi:hypothetical protein
MRHVYPWVPIDQAHGRPRQVGPAYQKTRRPISGPNWPSWWLTWPLEDPLEDSLDDLIQNDLKTWRTWQDISGFRLSRSIGYGKCCNLDLGLQVITDKESGNRPHPLANIRWARRPLYHTQSSSNLHQQLDVGFYSPKARTSINSPCSLCSICSCATFEFLALDSTLRNN